MFVLIAVAFFAYTLCLAFVISKSSHVEIDFDEKGIIEIDNQISSGFDGLDIEIYTFEGECIYSESVEINQFYIARENKYIVNALVDDKTTQTVSIDDEKITWKYIIDLCELVDTDGKYYIVVQICEENKRIELSNTFTVEDGKFVYAQENIDKLY